MCNWRAPFGLGAFLVAFGTSDAKACDASRWEYEREEGECLEIFANDHGEPSAKNTCSETIEVRSLDCSGACPGDMALLPGQGRPLDLPPNPGAEDSFRLASSMNDSITFKFVANICPSEEGCSLGTRSVASSVWLGAPLVAAWVIRRRRLADFRRQRC
jgi:hypothetical protein